jgi:SAM-dependent methyltransferase
MSRVEREIEFNNSQAEQEWANRRQLNHMGVGFYSKDDNSPIWGPIWPKLDLRGKNVLDYGCGPGDFSVLLVNRGASVTGIDISDKFVEMAERCVPAGLTAPKFFVRDGHNTGFPDATFDYVFGNGILHHLDLDKAYAEIARILKPGGRAYFMEPLHGHPLVRLVRWATPESRSMDERPMTGSDISRARSYFRNVIRHDHYLFAVAAAPVHYFGATAGKVAVRVLDRFDRAAFAVIPGLGNLAWLCMIEFQKDEPQKAEKPSTRGAVVNA